VPILLLENGNVAKYQQRQLVDVSDPLYSSVVVLPNTTNGSWWIFQILSTRRVSWMTRRVRKEVNDPLTAVSGIRKIALRC
jgi:hypothetical protein